MSGKHIKTKRNPKFEYKYLGPFEIVEAVGKQAYKLKLPAKWYIYLVFYVLLLERNVTRREAVDQKIANQLEFEEREQSEQEADSIIDSMVFAEEAVDSRPPELYYPIYKKGKTHLEDTWEPVEGVSHLRQLLKKYHTENPKKPTVAFPPIDKGASPPLMAVCSGTKLAPYTPTLTRSPICKYLLMHNRLPVRVSTTSGPNQHSVSQLRRSKRRRKLMSRH